MKKFLTTACLTAVALFGFSQISEANGLFRRCRGCEAPCASGPAAEQKFEERKVTRYKQVMVEKEIDVIECKRITREEKYNYTVCVPVTKEEKRKVIVCTPTTKEVDYTYTVLVPKSVEKKVQCTTYKLERVTITEKVPVCRVVCVTCVDDCGRCFTKRERVTVMEERTRCCLQRTPVTTEQTVTVTVCEREERKGKKTICEIVRSEKEVTVKVCSMENQQREGVRTVCEFKEEKVKRKVQVCELQKYEETIKVAVGTSCGNDCGRGHRVSFLRRGSDCGSCCK